MSYFQIVLIWTLGVFMSEIRVSIERRISMDYWFPVERYGYSYDLCTHGRLNSWGELALMFEKRWRSRRFTCCGAGRFWQFESRCWRSRRC